jgi:hypothetical protein
MGIPFILFAQDDATEEKQRARISLDYFNVNNVEDRLIAVVKTRVEGFWVNVEGVTVNLYRDVVSPENLLERKSTDMEGRAVFTFPASTDRVELTYIATIENDEDFRDADKDVTVQKARIDMNLKEVDSVYIAGVFIGAVDSIGEVTPIEGINVRIFVTRLFGLMPVSRDILNTDENGMIEMEFPRGIPGKEQGNLTIVAQVSDHDDYGNLEASEVKAWGTFKSLDESAEERELWLSSSNTPRFLLIAVNLMILGILGVIVYIVRQLFRIRKLGRVAD